MSKKLRVGGNHTIFPPTRSLLRNFEQNTSAQEPRTFGELNEPQQL